MTSENQPEYTLRDRLEALLFVAPGPSSVAHLAAALQVTVSVVEKGLAQLEEGYANGRGLRLQRHLGKVQLTTAPGMTAEIERYLGLESRARLSRAALETLAIIAYRRPVTRPQIDEVRGVNSDSALRSLLRSELIEEVGRATGPGRPILYSVTPEFLQHFGLNSLAELPPLDFNDLDADRTELQPEP